MKAANMLRNCKRVRGFIKFALSLEFKKLLQKRIVMQNALNEN